MKETINFEALFKSYTSSTTCFYFIEGKGINHQTNIWIQKLHCETQNNLQLELELESV